MLLRKLQPKNSTFYEDSFLVKTFLVAFCHYHFWSPHKSPDFFIPIPTFSERDKKIGLYKVTIENPP
jgi:hypothetical protein